MVRILISTILASAFALTAFCEVHLGTPFSNGAVLQRGLPLPIWGQATPGMSVDVSFAGQRVEAVANEKGDWKVVLRPLATSKSGQDIAVREVAGSGPDARVLDKKTVSDVLVGEVWFASGQSNMECPIWGTDTHFRDGRGALVREMTRLPLVRYCVNARRWSAEPVPIRASWRAMTPENVRDLPFSAVAYYYARELFLALDVPIGIVEASWGGTNIEPWIPRCGYDGCAPSISSIANYRVRSVWDEEAVAAGPYKHDRHQPTVLFNGMVASWAPMAMRGFIWYQGCNNAKESESYCALLHALYDGWSKAFGNPGLKMYLAQLAPYKTSWMGIASAQDRFVAEEPNAALAVTADAGNFDDIHPNEKEIVARRLAVHALKRDYGFGIPEDMSPTARRATADGSIVRVAFDHVRSWYVYSKDWSRLAPFDLAGADGVWHSAKIVNYRKRHDVASKAMIDTDCIEGDTIALSSEDVRSPVRIRYMGRSRTAGTLYNESSLPLGPFEMGCSNSEKAFPDFESPPESAKPIVRWFWMGEDISASGIAHDLEAMKTMGVRGANIMFQSWFGYPRGKVRIFSDEWWRLVMFAGKEADRLGLELSFHLCPGWSSSGGPSVRPEHAQKVLRYTETQLSGGRRVSVKLPQVEAPFGWRRDVATLAVPLREGEAGFVVTPEASAPNTFVFPEPREVSSAVVSVRNAQKGDLALDQLRLGYVVEVSSDGRTFREHARPAETAMEPEHVLTFPRVTARAVRLVATGGRPDIVSVRFSSVPLIPHYARKTLTSYCRKANVRPRVPADTFDCPADQALAPDQVIDVSRFVSDDDTLVWDAPPGLWRILRFTAVVQAKATNHIAPPGGSGLEVDKLSPKAAEVALGILVDPLLARARQEGVKAFKTAFLDSFEVPVQNWTDDFAAEFRRRRGYDLVPYLPTFTGVFVESTERTERFLNDFRKTWAELFAENYGDRLCAAVRARGLSFMRQSYLGPFDELRAGREADIPAVEFWYKTPLPRVDFGALAASLGNVYGRRTIAAEAFTDGIASAGDIHNEQIPLMRKIGDKAFADGVNLFELHGFEHQPSDDPAQRKKWPFGCRFDRHHPDFASFRPFCAYLTRAQYLLQQGRGVADILYLADGPSPVQAAWEPAVPFGWKGDCIDPDTFRRDVRKVGDRWVLPHGMEYRVLVKPGTAPADLLAMLVSTRLPPDFTAMEGGCPVKADEIAFAHRTTADGEVYFVSNQDDRPKILHSRFRAQGACEILDAETGLRQPVPVEKNSDGTSELNLDMPAGKSRFVVFGHK